MEGRLQDVQDAQGQQDHKAGCCVPCTQCGQLPVSGGAQLGLSGAHAHMGGARRGEAKVVDGPKLHSCKLCNFSSRYANHVKRHMKTHNGEKPYCCPLCAYASAQLVNLQRHVRVHTGEKPYKCPLCAFACSSLGNLKRHQRMHGPSKRSCGQGRPVPGHRPREGPPGAQAAAVRNTTLNINSEANYSNSKPEEESKNPLEANRSEEGVRGKGGGLPRLLFPFTCEVCGRDLEGSSETHTCGRCTLNMLSKELPDHLGDVTDDKLYPCPACPFVTHYPNHLSRHMKTHTGERPYKCPDCSYASAHFDNLKRHHRVHTGERPYKCPECDYACGNLANLRRHQRIHTGVKPFGCDLCSYTCNQSMNLKRHMLRHTGEKPFRCQECPYSTGHWDNYKRHQRKHGHTDNGWAKVRLPDEEDVEEE